MQPGRSRTPNHALRAAIDAARLTYSALARRVRLVAEEHGDRSVRTNSAAVAHWVKGTPPRPATVAYLVEALSRRLGRIVTPAELGLTTPAGDASSVALAADPVASVAQLGRADLDRRSFLASAVYSIGALTLPLSDSLAEAAGRGNAIRAGAMVGAAEVATVREVTEVFTRADERLGGDTGRSAVVQYLATDVAGYCHARFADDSVRRGMFGAAAELSYLAGWKAHDAGRAGLAQRYYLHAYQLAYESDPHGHAAYVLRILAHQAFDNGHHTHCVNLANAALSRVRGHVDAETESLFWLTLGRAHAAERDRRAALSAISRAEKLISTARADHSPHWAGLGGPAEARLANQTAKALVAMGDMTAGQEQFRQSAQSWNPATHPRVYALTLADLGRTQLAQGYIQATCETWSAALDRIDGVSSARIRDAVAEMRLQLRVFDRRGVPEAKALDARAAALQAAHAAAS